MKFNLKDKRAIVTGGGSGIGQAIAMILASQGAEVHILDLSVKNMDETLKNILNNNGKCYSHLCDVSNQDNVLEITNTIQEGGTIDILVNNAGISHIGNIENTNEQDFDKVFKVNVKGMYNCMKAVVPIMKNRGGVIINMASIAASVGIKDRFAYSMSKGAVLTMTYSVAKDYLKHNIRCNSISPGRVHTPFVDGFIKANYPGKEAEMLEKLAQTQPIGRMGTPKEIAHLALYLCSDEASFITGTDFPIDGGFIKLNGN